MGTSVTPFYTHTHMFLEILDLTTNYRHKEYIEGVQMFMMSLIYTHPLVLNTVKTDFFIIQRDPTTSIYL